MNNRFKEQDITTLREELEELRVQLYEANSIIEAIRENSVDALVLNKNGKPAIYSIESADYTYRLLIEKFDIGALSVSDEGLVLYCNAYFSKLAGIPANKITGTYFNSYIESVGNFQQLKTNLHTGSSNGEIVLNIGGKKLYVHMSLTDLRPSVSAIGIVVTDLAEKRRQKEDLELCQSNLELKIKELEGINASLKQFFHVVSHDLKEPLRKIIAASETRDLGRGHIAHADQLSSISASAGRLNSLVENLVKNAQEVSRDVLVKIDLNKTIDEVTEDLSLMVSESGVRIVYQQLPQITGSEVQLRQLFLNVLAYSIRVCRNHRRPLIMMEAEITDCVDMHSPNKKFHRVSIRNNASEIDRVELEQIATLFDQSLGNEFPGGDVGMVICKRIMDQYEGRISLEPVPGAGYMFILCFPLEEPQSDR